MRVSREARIVLGLTLLAAAVFVWAYFFTQRQVTDPLVAPGSSQPAISSSPAADPAVATEAGDADALVTPNADPATITTDDGAAVITTDAPEAVGAEGVDTGIAIIVPESMTTAARDIVIAELPFLITEPPLLEAGGLEGEGAEGSTLERPAGEQRITVNPFSPILLQEVVAAPANPAPTPVAIPERAPTPVIQEVAIPDGPPVPAEPVVETVVPTPPALPTPSTIAPLRTFTPPTPLATALPRPLPGGTLPVVPDILLGVQRAPVLASQNAEPTTITTSAAIRLPAGAAPGVALAGAPQQAQEQGEVVPELLSLGEATAPVVSENVPTEEVSPLMAGVTPVAAYLRDNNVRFTGYVIGPVGVGVFRSNERETPIVLPIGQSLPNTDIVLSSLEGKEAAFSQNDETYALTLDFWR